MQKKREFLSILKLLYHVMHITELNLLIQSTHTYSKLQEKKDMDNQMIQVHHSSFISY